MLGETGSNLPRGVVLNAVYAAPKPVAQAYNAAQHMTAPSRLAEPLTKTLAQRGRPHLTTPYQ
jgi:hypothetical protein